MKKFVFVFVFLLLPSCAFADDDSNNYWSKYSIYRNAIMQPQQLEEESTDDSSQKTMVNDELYQKVYQNYGCIYSPGYLNRENIDTGETNNGFAGR